LDSVENYRRWFDYEKDSHAKVIDSLQGISEDNRSSSSFQKAVDLMAHLIAARRMWLYRFGFAKENAELFPRSVLFSTLAGQLAEMEAGWSAYLEKLTDTELERVFEYQSYEGSRFRNTVADILTQLFGHSWYHRGQIAALVRALGAEPAVTDFVFWSRELVEDKSQRGELK
jgi:uncharacterized damage-inducible protein DinB